MYSRGRRGAPAKGVGRVTVARVQISPSPPKESKLNINLLSFTFSLDLNKRGTLFILPRFDSSTELLYTYTRHKANR